MIECLLYATATTTTSRDVFEIDSTQEQQPSFDLTEADLSSMRRALEDVHLHLFVDFLYSKVIECIESSILMLETSIYSYHFVLVSECACRVTW